MKLYKTKKNVDGKKIVKRYYLCGVKFLYKSWNGHERVTRFFGITVSRHGKKKKFTNQIRFVNQSLYTKNQLNQFKNTRKIDIVIPVYNGLDYLETLFDSLEKNTDLDWKAYVVNDHSTDNRVYNFLRSRKKILKDKMILIENNENLGFVKSINIALTKCTHDVVMINTDVVLPKNWASRLFYPIFIDKSVGSVTPFSNSATIFSLPKISPNNKLEVDLEEINRALMNNKCDFSQVRLCTGVGFCMAMSRMAIEKIGVLDEIYGKGYSEENDWCQRAIENGFYNTICPNLLVWHKNGGSFLTKEKKDLSEKHMDILLKRYPSYFVQLDNNLKNPAFLFTRFLAELIYLNLLACRTCVWFTYNEQSHELPDFNSDVCLNIEKLNFVVKSLKSFKVHRIAYFYREYKNEFEVNTLELEFVLKKIRVNNTYISYSDSSIINKKIYNIVNFLTSKNQDKLDT